MSFNILTVFLKLVVNKLFCIFTSSFPFSVIVCIFFVLFSGSSHSPFIYPAFSCFLSIGYIPPVLGCQAPPVISETFMDISFPFEGSSSIIASTRVDSIPLVNTLSTISIFLFYLFLFLIPINYYLIFHTITPHLYYHY